MLDLGSGFTYQMLQFQEERLAAVALTLKASDKVKAASGWEQLAAITLSLKALDDVKGF